MTTLPNGNTVTQGYDTLNYITATDGIGALTTYAYDPVGNRLTETDGNGNTSSTAYDALDRMVSMTDALGKASVYQYDPVGNVIKTTDRNGNFSGGHNANAVLTHRCRHARDAVQLRRNRSPERRNLRRRQDALVHL